MSPLPYRLLFSCLSILTNPITTKLTPVQIQKIKVEYLPSMLSQLKHIDLNRSLESSGVKVSKIVIDTPGLDVHKIKVEEIDNQLEVSGSNISTSISFEAEVNKSFINKKGTGKVKGAVKQINFLLNLSQIFDLDIEKPEAFVTFNTFTLDEDDLDISLDIEGIPSFIISFIISLMKGHIVREISELALRFVQSFGQQLVSELLTQKLSTIRNVVTQTTVSASVLGN